MKLLYFVLLLISLICQIGMLCYLKYYNQQHQHKTLLCLSYIIFLYIQLKEITNSNCKKFQNNIVTIISLTILLCYKYYFTRITTQIQNNQNTENSENIFKVPEPEHEFPSNLPPIMSENESKISSQQSQIEPNTTVRVRQEQAISYTNKYQNKQSNVGFSFLGEYRASQMQKSQQKQSIMQLSTINQNVNLIKYSDEGEIKFGILKTLKSINYESVEKDLDTLQKEPIITKSDYPKIQILYESSQQDSQQELQSRQSQNQQAQQQLKEIKTDQSILHLNPKFIPSQMKTITWKIILHQFIYLQILILGFSINVNEQTEIQKTSQYGSLLYQIVFFISLSLAQFAIYQKLIIKGFEITYQIKQLLICYLLIFLPLISLTLKIEYYNNNLQFFIWLQIIMVLLKISKIYKYQKLFGPLIFFLTIGTLFI